MGGNSPLFQLSLQLWKIPSTSQPSGAKCCQVQDFKDTKRGPVNPFCILLNITMVYCIRCINRIEIHNLLGLISFNSLNFVTKMVSIAAAKAPSVTTCCSSSMGFPGALIRTRLDPAAGVNSARASVCDGTAVWAG